MIERACIELPGVIVALNQSESGGWERDGVRLPWCGIRSHKHQGLRGFKIFAGDWMLGVYALRREVRP